MRISTCSQAGQRTTAPGAFTYTSTRPTALTVPQPPHVLMAEVISRLKISPSRPPIALPSSLRSDIWDIGSSSCGAEAFGLDPAGVVAMVDEQARRRLDERGRATDEHLRAVRPRPGHRFDHRPVQPARV